MFPCKHFAWGFFLFSSGLAGCTQHLSNQPRYSVQGQSQYFSDGRADRLPVSGTIPQTKATDPILWDREDLLRAQERYTIYCSFCHDSAGTGYGPVVRRGFMHPPSFSESTIRTLGNRDIYGFITNGLGPMPGFASSIPERDRHLIVGYVRVLQLRTRVPRQWLTRSDLQALGDSP